METRRPPHLFPVGASLGTDSVVLQARSRTHRVDNYAGPLSVKTVLSGEVSWLVGARSLTVDPGSFLILAEGERYSMNIDAVHPVETCCAFFAPGFVERVAQDLTSSLASGLDDPQRPGVSLPYLSALHGDRERVITRFVQGLAVRCSKALAPSGFQEDFLVLAHQLLCLYGQIRTASARVAASRESTRKELFKRLLAGREYLHAHSTGPVSLTEAARASCLSPFHFHRGFTQAFQVTPHAYLTELRLDRARRLIEAGSPVLRACVEVGFSSPSSFTKLFASRYGVTPSAARRDAAGVKALKT